MNVRLDITRGERKHLRAKVRGGSAFTWRRREIDKSRTLRGWHDFEREGRACGVPKGFEIGEILGGSISE